MIKVIMIDPFRRNIYEAKIDNSLHAMQTAVMGNIEHVAVGIKGMTLWVNEEGLFRGDQKFFKFAGYDQPLAGYGLITGPAGPEGETQGTELTVAQVERYIRWER